VLYRLTDEAVERIPETEFAAEGVLERSHLQRLLRRKIDVIGPDLMVIAEEFAAFSAANRRIDLLCLSKTGELVVVELKRTESGGHMELQALRYAAFVSAMTLEQVVVAHERYCEVTGEADPATAETRIREFLEELADEPALGRSVRIVLVSADFGIELTATVLWLNSFEGMDVRCVRLRPHNLDGQIVLDVQQVIPLPEASAFMMRVRHREAVAQTAAADGRDLTKFVISSPAGETPPLAKRHAAHAMVAAVLEAGTPPEVLSTVLAGRRWRSVPGTLTGSELAGALEQDQPDIDLARYFMDKPFHVGGRTWVLRNGWGLNTVDFLARLRDLAPEAGIDFHAVPGPA
jgi:hypothetical protein